MQVKAPHEFIWRPVADAIDRWIDRREQTNGGLGWPLMLWTALIFIVISWAVTST